MFILILKNAEQESSLAFGNWDKDREMKRFVQGHADILWQKGELILGLYDSTDS